MEPNARNRLVGATIAVLVALTIGTVGFWIIEEGTISVGDCLYMTIITLSTVGYGEVIPLNDGGRIFASFLIIFGMGTLLYFGSTMIALWVEIDMRQVRRRRLMEKKIEQLSGHLIICGVGTTGAHVARELLATKTPFVMIDTIEERADDVLELARTKKKPPFIRGDATDDRILHQAGIDRASGIVAALRNDKDNLYIVISARQMNSKLRIIARATEKEVAPKMLRAGADRVVSPNLIGGLRIASEMIRPQVTEFLDMMMRDPNQPTRIEQVYLPDKSPLVGKCLLDTNIRKATDVLVIALRSSSGKYSFNPGPDTVLTADSTLIVLGATESVARLRKSVGATQGVGLIDD